MVGRERVMATTPEWFVVQRRDILIAQLEGRPRQITNPLIASMFTQGAMSQQHSWFPWQGCRQLICYDICAYCKQPCWFLCSTFKVSILLRHFHCNITPCQYVNTLHCLWQLTVFCWSSAYKSSDTYFYCHDYGGNPQNLASCAPSIILCIHVSLNYFRYRKTDMQF